MSTQSPCNYCGSNNVQMITRGIRDWEYGVEGQWDYQHCEDCGGVQISPFPDIEDLKKAYDIDYHGYAIKEHRGFLFTLLYALKESLFRRQMSYLVNTDSRVLDIGCGAGEFLLGLKSLGVTQLEGIDFNHEVIASLSEQGITGHLGTFENFSSDPSRYSVISMNNYLEHSLKPDFELSKCLELLSPGGHLVGELPGFDSLDRRLFGRFWGGNHVPRHTYQFTSAFLRERLITAGFVDIRITQELNTSHWALSVQNFLQRNRSDLRNNSSIVHGRSRYYLLLVLMFIPINLVSMLIKKSSCTKFYAVKPA